MFIDTESDGAQFRLSTFDIDETQRFDGSHTVLCNAGICPCIVLTHALSDQLTSPIHLVIVG